MRAPALALALVLAAAGPAHASWLDGDHATGTWSGHRDKLADDGVDVEGDYAAESFSNLIGNVGTALLGHVDVSVSVDTGKLGWWSGGTFFVLGQNGHGGGIDDEVQSVTSVSNLEASPYTQVTELFYEQTAWGGKLDVRLGKQDANRDFGTPRFGGNFINNNFGMFPSAPLPSYPTTALGAAVTVTPVSDLAVKAAVYDGRDFASNGSVIAVGGAAVMHHYGPAGRDGGTTSVDLWWQPGDFAQNGVPVDPPPPALDGNEGVMVQNDERIYRHPCNPDDPSGLTFITRFGWARPDRTPIALYVGASAAWHGLGLRSDDTIGLGFGTMTVEPQPGTLSLRPLQETFVEGFYKWRLTKFFSLQPDLEYYRHPNGTGRDALFVGARVKVKL